MYGRTTGAARVAQPPTVTKIAFETGTAVSTSAPNLGVATTEVTTTMMNDVLSFFGSLKLEYEGNLTPSEIASHVQTDAASRLVEQFGSGWGARVEDSEPVGNEWATSGSSWVHPTKDSGVIYAHSGSDYTLAKIKIVRQN